MSLAEAFPARQTWSAIDVSRPSSAARRPPAAGMWHVEPTLSTVLGDEAVNEPARRACRGLAELEPKVLPQAFSGPNFNARRLAGVSGHLQDLRAFCGPFLSVWRHRRASSKAGNWWLRDAAW